MANKGNVSNPFHSNFVAAVDDEFINEENIDTRRYLEDSKNLTPFRKMGAMIQTDGHTEVTGFASLPQPSGYILLKVYKYPLDRDSKEITVLVYEHITTGQIKYYVNPYLNPASTFSNYNPNKAENTWIAEWLELTETYQAQLNGAASTTTFSVDGDVPTLSTTDNYYNGWFVVNTDIGINGSAFNFIIDYVGSTKTFTTKTNTGWGDNHHITLVRFPVVYLHQMDVNADNYAFPVDNTFKAKPTDFNYRNNQLRIACGKEYRPLILDCIYKRDYFKGNSAISYDGLYFDFQQIPQRQKKSAVTGFASLTNSATSILYIDAATAKFVTTPPINGIKITCGTGIINLGIEHLPVPLNNGGQENLVILVANNIAVSDNKNIWFYYLPPFGSTPAGYLSIDIDDAVDALNNASCPLSQYMSFEKVVGSTGNLTTTSASFPVYSEHRAIQSISGQEAGGNIMSTNYFVGTEVFVTSAGSGDIISAISRNVFIATIIYDNRNEMLIGHGTYRPTSDGELTTDDGYGFELRFTTWFSRRITQFNLYTRALNDRNLQTTVNPLVKTLTVYPYYAWETKFDNGTSDYVRINELPLFNTYDIYEFDKTKNGERVENIRAAVGNTTGINAYTLDTTNYNWYTKFKDDYNGVKSTGKKVRFLVNANRYIDQDTTMNYTKMAYLGKTNGRYFPIGCKNTVEKDLFENDDTVLYNLYANGISQYDVILRDRLINSVVGDKDINRAVAIYGGYLIVIKDTCYYAVDVNTDNELRYRIIESQLDRGTRFPDAVKPTNYGIIMPSDDTVYLLIREQAIPLLTETNGKLALYRDILQNGGRVIGCESYNEFNELMLVLQKNAFNDVSPSYNIYTTYVFIYNFTKKAWTYQEYIATMNGGYPSTAAPNGVVPFQILTDTSRNTLLLNQFYSDLTDVTKFDLYKKFNIVKFDKNSYRFVKPDGAYTPIYWVFKTHFTAYSGRIFLTKLNWIILNSDVLTSDAVTNKNIEIIVRRTRKGLTVTDNVEILSYKYTPLTKNIEIEKMLLDLGEAEMIQIEIKNADSFLYFAIKSVYLEITSEKRALQNQT